MTTPRAAFRSRGRTALVALTVAAALALVSPWRVPLSSDGLLLLRTAFALAFTGSFRLPPAAPGAMLDPYTFLPAPGAVPGVVSVYAPFGALLRAGLLVPAGVLPAGAVRGAVADALLGLVPILATAGAVFPLARLARFGGAGKKAAPLLAGALIVTTFLGPLGVSDFQEPVLVLLGAAALERALWARRLRGARRGRTLAASSALLSLAILSKPTVAVMLPALLLGGVHRRRRGTRAGLGTFLLAAVPGVTLFFFLNAVRFGNPLASGYSHLLENPQARIADPLWTFLRLTVLPNRGLLWFAPLVLLAVWPTALRAWRGPRRTDRLAALVAAAALFATNLFWWAWEGGFCWGPRLLAPPVAVFVVLLPGRGSGWKRGAIVLSLAGIALNGSGYLLDCGRLYTAVAARPPGPLPLGPIAPIHRNPEYREGLHPLQRVHYVPEYACWIEAPRILFRLLRTGEGPGTGGRPGDERNDSLLLRLLRSQPVRPPVSSTGQVLLEEAQVTADVDPPRALKEALLAIDFGGPPVECRALGSMLLLRAGRPAEAARLCREGLALEPGRADLRQNLAIAESRLRAAAGATP
ncbi:MAG TPA: hypothetical protein VL084_05050 [Thermoanaerobaculia bacterium]|nr:hypothetical protein [Thermoanaerobaculia bacterium]